MTERDISGNEDRADALGSAVPSQAPFLVVVEDQASAWNQVAALGGDGSGPLMRELGKSPVAQKEYRECRPRSVDDIYMIRFDGADLVQWYARHADGYRRPFGRIFKIEQTRAVRPGPSFPQSSPEAGGDSITPSKER